MTTIVASGGGGGSCVWNVIVDNVHIAYCFVLILMLWFMRCSESDWLKRQEREGKFFASRCEADTCLKKNRRSSCMAPGSSFGLY